MQIILKQHLFKEESFNPKTEACLYSTHEVYMQIILKCTTTCGNNAPMSFLISIFMNMHHIRRSWKYSIHTRLDIKINQEKPIISSLNSS